jgi:hypothetical protein
LPCPDSFKDMQRPAEDRSWPRPFSPGGFQIQDSRLEDHGEVVLWCVGGPPPQCGSLFTIEHDDVLHDVFVVEIRSENPGWSALCQRVQIAWGA